jgi:hypothetical protein
VVGAAIARRAPGALNLNPRPPTIAFPLFDGRADDQAARLLASTLADEFLTTPELEKVRNSSLISRFVDVPLL